MKRLCYYFIFFFICIATIFSAAISFVVHNNIIDFSALERYSPGKPTILLDCHGKEWARFALDKRKVVHIEDMPQHLIQAFLAAEDWDFYDHFGLSIKGIVRSFLVNMYHRRVVQGASTITQQLVRLLFFDHQRTFTRKVKEQLVALLVEMKFSKDQILETYLNHVYFSCGIYGVEAAAQRFWGKSAADVTIDEAAILAGIMRSPGMFSPLLNPLATQKRRNVVLAKMLRLDFITQKEFDDATFKMLKIKKSKQCIVGLHAREHIRKFLEQLIGKHALYTGGYVVQTTIDLEIQQKAEKAFIDHVTQIRKTINPAIDGSLLTLDVSTGQIRALIGGADFTTSKFNRALQARRQLGSVFKPLIFAVALQNGIKFSDVLVDEPIEIKDEYGTLWRPNNYNRKFNGPITLAYALSRSNNIVLIKTFLRIGAQKVIALAKKAHLPGPFHSYASLSLGCIDTTLQEAVGMFNIFANHGMYVDPHMIVWAKDSWGNKIYKHKEVCESIMPSHISGQILKVLGLGLDRVRALIPQRWTDCQAASKTGTTNDHRTCWFVGSTPELTTGVYIGCDDNQPMGKNVYPLHTAFPIWIGLHREIKSQKKIFSYDPSLQEVIIDEKTGLQLADNKRKGAISIFV
jgi:penicillin-binding protein 1A